MVRVSMLDLPDSLRPSGVDGELQELQLGPWGRGGRWSTSLGSLVAGSPLTVSLPPGRATVTAATTPTLGSRASRSRGRVEGILSVTREGVGESNGGDPILSV